MSVWLSPCNRSRTQLTTSAIWNNLLQHELNLYRKAITTAPYVRVCFVASRRSLYNNPMHNSLPTDMKDVSGWSILIKFVEAYCLKKMFSSFQTLFGNPPQKPTHSRSFGQGQPRWKMFAQNDSGHNGAKSLTKASCGHASITIITSIFVDIITADGPKPTQDHGS